MPLNLVVWLFGLLISALPIVIVFATILIPDAANVSDLALIDVARQAYPNILFVVIAISGVAIAEAVIVFFRMVETGRQHAMTAMWLLCSILLIVYGAIAYGKVAGTNFIPSAISSQQITFATCAALIALMAALSLRYSMLKLENLARQQIHDDLTTAPLDLGIERIHTYDDLDDDPYDLGGLRAAREASELEEPNSSQAGQGKSGSARTGNIETDEIGRKSTNTNDNEASKTNPKKNASTVKKK